MLHGKLSALIRDNYQIMTDTETLATVSDTDGAGDTTESSSTCHDTVPHDSVLSSTVLLCTERQAVILERLGRIHP